MDNPAMAGNHGDHAGQLVFINIFLHDRPDTVKEF